MCDVGTQVELVTADFGTSCNIQIEQRYVECPNCFARENAPCILSDHSYTQPIITADTCKKSKTTTKEQDESESSDDGIIFKTPVKINKSDPLYIPSDDSDMSPALTPNDKAPASNLNKTDPVQEKKMIVFESCLRQILSMIVCTVCRNTMDMDDMKFKYEGTSLSVLLTCLNSHNFTWRSQPLLTNNLPVIFLYRLLWF